MTKRIIWVVLAAMIVVACAPLPKPETAVVSARPITAPMKTLTNFSEALSCMDNLMLSRGSYITVTSSGLPDQTSEIKAGTREMMISAISKMSVRSRGFRYVDYDQSQSDVASLHQLIGGAQGGATASQGKFIAPEYYIRGAISQIDRGVLLDSNSAGLTFMGGGGGNSTTLQCDQTGCKPAPAGGGGGQSGNLNAGIGYNQQASSSVISMDIHVGDLVTRQILPGVSTSNSIVLTSKGHGFDFDATIQKVGLNFNSSVSRAEGPGAAVRTLIELSLIESLGKLAEVPYWTCLGQDSTNSDLIGKTRNDYDKLGPEELIKTIQAALTTSGHYAGTVTGVLDDVTKDAIRHYQSENNLIANGRIDFDLYHNLVVNHHIAGSTDSGIVVPPSALSRVDVALNVSSNKGPKPVLAIGEKLQVSVDVSGPAFVYCYYQDAQGQVSRIFPNRFTPNAALTAGKRINIPPTSSPFDLVMKTAGNRERVDCVASRDEIGTALPQDMMMEDLQPMVGKTVAEVIDEFTKRDAKSSHKTLRIHVLD